VLTLELVVKKHGKRITRLERPITQLADSVNEMKIEMIKGQSELRQEIASSNSALRLEIAKSNAELRKFVEHKFNWILTSICATLMTTIGLLGKFVFDFYTRL